MKAYLVVDKKEYAENVDDIKDSAKDKKLRTLIKVALKRPLTEEESLLEAFKESDDELHELDLKKNFFYVLNPEGKIIDCAKIYSFMHEDNIYQRIIAKILKDIDELNTGTKIVF